MRRITVGPASAPATSSGTVEGVDDTTRHDDTPAPIRCVQWRLEYTSMGSDKFYELSICDRVAIFNYGRNGSTGNPAFNLHPTHHDACDAAWKQAAAKIRKGYYLVSPEAFIDVDRSVFDGLTTPGYTAFNAITGAMRHSSRTHGRVLVEVDNAVESRDPADTALVAIRHFAKNLRVIEGAAEVFDAARVEARVQDKATGTTLFAMDARAAHLLAQCWYPRYAFTYLGVADASVPAKELLTTTAGLWTPDATDPSGPVTAASDTASLPGALAMARLILS